MLAVLSCLDPMREAPSPRTAAYAVKYKITDRDGNITGYLIREVER